MIPVREKGQLGLALVFTWVVSVLLLIQVARSSAVLEIDFLIFYSGARIVLEGNGDRLYEPEVQAKAQRGIFARDFPLPYNHPPFELLPFIPLAFLPYRIAYAIWGMVNAGIAVAVVWLLHRHRRGGRALGPVRAGALAQTMRETGALPKPENPLALALLVFLFLPVWVALGQGQDSMLLMLLFVLAYRHFTDGKILAAGFWIGLATFKFQLALPLFALLLRRGGRRLAAGMACAVTAGFLASIALVGWDGLRQYPGFVLQMDQAGRYETMQGKTMSNLRGFADTIAGEELSLTVQAALHAFFGLLALTFCWRSKASGPELFGVAILLATILTYHMHTYDLSVLILPLLIAMQIYERGWRGPALLLCFSVVYTPWTHGYESLVFLVFVGIVGLATLALTAGRDGSSVDASDRSEVSAA